MIDLNCDMGEGFGSWAPGVDAEVMALVTSANIACGAHAGDPMVMRATVDLARQHGVAIGAHPGYPDLQGFGRRAMELSAAEVEAFLIYQIGALKAFTVAAGVELSHVKAHGALYNTAARDLTIARAIARAVAAVDPSLILVALAGSAMVQAGEEQGLSVAREAFADRAYHSDGTLRPRSLPGAVHHNLQSIVDQAVRIAVERRVTTFDAQSLTIDADTLCLHGDTPAAAQRARAIVDGLAAAGVPVRPLRAILDARRS